MPKNKFAITFETDNGQGKEEFGFTVAEGIHPEATMIKSKQVLDDEIKRVRGQNVSQHVEVAESSLGDNFSVEELDATVSGGIYSGEQTEVIGKVTIRKVK